MIYRNTLARARRTFTRQLEQSDCGTAALLSVLRYHGGNLPRPQLQVWSGSTEQGATLLGLCQAARQAGLSAEGFQASPETLHEAAFPCLLHVENSAGRGHFWVCYGQKGPKWLIGDPASGMRWVDGRELARRWTSGFLLQCTPTDRLAQHPLPPRWPRWLLGLCRQQAPLLAGIAALGTAVAVLGLATSWCTQLLIDRWLPEGSAQGLATGIALLAWLLVLRAVLQLQRGNILLRLGISLQRGTMEALFGLAMAMPVPLLRLRSHADWMARIRDGHRLQQLLALLAGQALVDALAVGAGLVLLAYYHPQLAWAGLASTLLLGLLARWPLAALRERMKTLAAAQAASESFHLEALQQADAVQLAGKTAPFAAKSAQWHQGQLQAQHRAGLLQLRATFGLELANALLLALFVGWGGYLHYHGSLALGAFMGAWSAWGVVMQAGHRLAGVWGKWQEGRVVLDRLVSLGEAKAARQASPAGLGNWAGLAAYRLGHQFGGAPAPLWEQATFAILPGELVGLVGGSGRGKSTLLEIAMGLYPPKQGFIMTRWQGEEGPADLPLGCVPASEWRKAAVLVPQHPAVFQGTLLDNLRWFEPHLTAEAVVAECQAWGLHAYFEALPRGYDTVVGEGGLRLSGGQRRLLAMARALLQRPQLLLLDEPFSGLDPASAGHVAGLLRRLRGQCGLLVATHQPEWILPAADRIYELRPNGLALAHKRGKAPALEAGQSAGIGQPRPAVA
jgi:ATP-binding cassette subfamily B protein